MSDKGKFRVSFDALGNFMRKVFLALGVPPNDARICADVLLEADKRGIDSHGIARLKTIYYDRIKSGIQKPVTKLEIVKETPATAVFDAHNGMGMVASKKAMETAIKKAAKCGVAMTVVKNSTHYGIAGYYVLQAVARDMIGITGTNARPSVAPTFGVENMLGTNPLTFGIPTDEEFPFVLDCATSIIQRGKIEVYARKNKKIPKGWVIGADGKFRINARQILMDLKRSKAALLPLGGFAKTSGYKGYGYATVVEILSAALAGGKFLKSLSGEKGGKKIPIPLGHFFIAINISSFIPPEEFKKISGGIVRALRKSRKAPGQARIYTAGEKEHLAFLERSEKGVPLAEKTREEIKRMAAELGIEGLDFTRRK